jgi:nitroreductase
MNFLDLLKHRRSIRQYKEEAVSKEALEAIVEAGLLSPSGRNIRPWELIVVQKKETLEKMSECRVGSAKMLAPQLRSL